MVTHEDQRQHAIMEALRGVALFRGLPDAELTGLAAHVIRRHYECDQLIFAQGERGDGLYIVAQGHVGITRQEADGAELLLTLAGPGEYFGELALFDGAPRSAGATAMEECRLLVLPRDAFRAFLEAHPGALWTCLEVIVGLLRRLTAVADDIALLDLRGRLARCLLRLAAQGAIAVAGETAERPRTAPHITQQHLANMLGATRERVNKRLQALGEDGLIALERGQVRILDRARLEEVAAGDV
jgi:CRP/FNR family transcriptional regulator